MADRPRDIRLGLLVGIPTGTALWALLIGAAYLLIGALR